MNFMESIRRTQQEVATWPEWMKQVAPSIRIKPVEPSKSKARPDTAITGNAPENADGRGRD